MPKIVCDTYKIPTWEADQLIEAWGEDIPRALDAAIDVCRERARLYCMPARWEAFHNPDGSMTVKRYRNYVRPNSYMSTGGRKKVAHA